MNTVESTQQLVDRLRAGDRSALGELFDVYRDPLRRLVQLRMDGRLAGRVSPSDVLQEAYIDALKRLDHYLQQPDMPFSLWLRLVTGQSLVDAHRRHLGAQMRDATLEHSLYRGASPAASSVCLASALLADVSSPSAAAIRGELSLQVEEALSKLDPIDREVLALRHFEELSNNEVAELLGIDKHAASKRYVRGLARLKKVLETIPGFDQLSNS